MTALLALLSMVEGQIAFTGFALATVGALLGSVLVLRGQAMAADAVAHAIVLGIVLVWMATGAESGPLAIVGAATAGVLSVLAAQSLAQSGLMRSDSALGLAFSGMFALGVLLISAFGRRVHLDTDRVLLGEIGLVWLNETRLFDFALPFAGVTLWAIALGLALLGALFWKELKLAAFDSAFAEVQGFYPQWIERGLLGATALAAVAAFEAVGVVLFLAFVVVPALSARLLAQSLAGVVVLALVFAWAAVALGLVVGFALDVNLGGAMALATGLGLLAALVAAPRAGLVALLRKRAAWRLRARREALLLHLARHAGTPEASAENRPQALITDLKWSEKTAKVTTESAIAAGFVQSMDQGKHARLELTEAGRAEAEHIARRYDRRKALSGAAASKEAYGAATDQTLAPERPAAEPGHKTGPEPKAK